MGHLNVRERVFPNIWAQKGVQIGPPEALFWGPILRPSRRAPGHLNVRERVFGPIPAQEGLRIGSREGPNRPPRGPQFEAEILCMPPCFKGLLFNIPSPGDPPEGLFWAPGGAPFEAKSLCMPPCL